MKPKRSIPFVLVALVLGGCTPPPPPLMLEREAKVAVAPDIACITALLKTTARENSVGYRSGDTKSLNCLCHRLCSQRAQLLICSDSVEKRRIGRDPPRTLRRMTQALTTYDWLA